MPRTYVRGAGQRVPRDNARIRFYEPRFYDPYFFIQGSIPEKMVMKERRLTMLCILLKGLLLMRVHYIYHPPQINLQGFRSILNGFARKDCNGIIKESEGFIGN